MMTPVLAARQFGWAMILGGLLAVVYSFLRPIRPRFLADLLFLPALLWGWCILSFPICRGDIRMGITLGLAAGFFLWDKTLGRLTDRLFRWLWRGVFRILTLFCSGFRKFFKKTGHFRKFFLASRKKTGTI